MTSTFKETPRVLTWAPLNSISLRTNEYGALHSYLKSLTSSWNIFRAKHWMSLSSGHRLSIVILMFHGIAQFQPASSHTVPKSTRRTFPFKPLPHLHCIPWTKNRVVKIPQIEHCTYLQCCVVRGVVTMCATYIYQCFGGNCCLLLHLKLEATSTAKAVERWHPEYERDKKITYLARRSECSLGYSIWFKSLSTN